MAEKKRIKAEIPKSFLKYIVIIVAALIFVAYIVAITRFTLFDFALIIGFILIGAAARIPQRFVPIALGVELVSTFTIVSAIRYGSLVGAIVGSASFIISGYFTIERPQDVLAAVIGFIGMALFGPIAYAFFTQNLGMVAIALTIGYDIFTGIFYLFMGYGIFSVLRFSAMHIVSNFLIIGYLGAKLLGL